MHIKDKIYVAGHKGLVGSSVIRLLTSKGFNNILTTDRKDVNLINQSEVNNWFEQNKPTYVILAAGKVGGINFNSLYKAEFLYENVMIQTNIIHASHITKVNKLICLGSSCIYPKENPLPIVEERLLAGPLEYTNEGYSLAKIVGLKLCEYYNNQYGDNFISAMPCNLYGPNDCFDLEKCHVIPALITKFHKAKINNEKTITMWGTGISKREFLYVDDLSNAIYTLLDIYNDSNFINVGSGVEIGMKDLFSIMSRVIKYNGELIFDSSKPDGTISKLIDNTKILKLGWKPTVDIESGIEKSYNWYLNSL